MNDQQLLRYSRQILMPELGIEGQERLLNSHALIFGLGALGSPVAAYLAAAGVGKLTLVDFDQLELSNLQRQIIHQQANIGQNKTTSAVAYLKALNPEVDYQTLDQRLEEPTLSAIISQADVVLDCTDNFPSRFAINQACVQTQTPLISGAAIRFEGQFASFDFTQPDCPCYRCLYTEDGETEDTCSTTGILAPVAGLIGSLQATEALKILSGMNVENGALTLFDAKYREFRQMKFRQDPDCPVCGDHSK